MTEVIIKPHARPRDIADGVLSLGVGLLQVFVIFGLPGFVFFWVTNNTILGFAAAVAAYFVFLLFSVSKLVVTPEGIRLSRILGSPKFIAWSTIESIQVAPRSELIWHGWLWPIFPANEMTPSFTSVGHYRIRYNDRLVYFPPNDPVSFMEAIRPYVRDCA